MELVNFWSGVDFVNDPRFKTHPIRHRRATDRHKAGALRIHGDGVPFTKHKSLETLSISSLHGDGQSLDSRFLMTAICKVLL